MRARFLVGAWVASFGLAGCNAIIGLKAPPEQDASLANGSDATTEGSAGGNPDGSVNGSACSADGTCASGHCADGVCCDNACSGTCEACNLAGSPGKCTAVPAGTDPQMECVMVPVVDAGAAAPVDAATPDAAPADDGDTPETGAAVDAAAEGGDAGSEASAADAGGFDGSASAINFPDSGYTSNDTTCAGACDGRGGDGGGSCTYPDGTHTCGTQFCNAPDQAAGFACNGGGLCTLSFTSCSAYSCKGSACGANCTQESDCLPGYYCDSATTKCQPTFGNGLNCTNSNECTSGFCTTGVGGSGSPVCCTSDCTIPGGSCTKPGAVGQCECMMDCDGGACTLFYQDADGDGYGNMYGMTSDSTAKLGCTNQTPPGGYVVDHTDCDDGDPNVHPGQTMYFAVKSKGLHIWDYNCDGTIQKGTPEFPGATCEFCTATPTCGASAATCTTSAEQATFGCGPRFFCLGGTCKPPSLCPIRCSFTGCYPSTDTAFTSTVDCGATGTTTTCGTCGGPGEAAGTGTINSASLGVQQTCH